MTTAKIITITVTEMYLGFTGVETSIDTMWIDGTTYTSFKCECKHNSPIILEELAKKYGTIERVKSYTVGDSDWIETTYRIYQLR